MKTARTSRTTNARAWKAKFLASLAATGNVSHSAEAAGVSRSFVYEYRVRQASFAAEWDAALDQAAPVLEEEMWRRAVEGVEEPVFGRVGKDQDGQIGTVRKYSDALLTTLVKAVKPEKYRDRQQIDVNAGIYKVYTATDEFDPNAA